MASFKFDGKSGKAVVYFRYDGKQYNKTVLVNSAREADRARAVAEQTIDDIKRRLVHLPKGIDPAVFIISGGKTARPIPTAVSTSTAEPTLGRLVELYHANPLPQHEPSTHKTTKIHLKHAQEVLGDVHLGSLDRAAIQQYVNSRAKTKRRGRPIQRKTIRMELQTLSQVWRWVAGNRSAGDIPVPTWSIKDLSFPKAKERLPFMSWSQIERAVAHGGLTDREKADHWNALWLDREQIREFLAFIKSRPAPGFFHPMVAFGAYTGARRSELCRSRRVDWRLSEAMVKIRQKKRDRDREISFRDVPIHPELMRVIEEWFGTHPGGQYAFPRADRSEPTWDEATYHLKQAIAGSKWSVIRGWHVLRHSFASNLAGAGVDQRKIDAWMGHSTEIRLRYQHLRPEDQQDAIAVL